MDDGKTTLEDDEAAIALSENWEYRLRIPRKPSETGVYKAKDTHLIMMALFVRLQIDNKFNEELRGWLDENKEQVLEHLGFAEIKLN